MKFFWDTNLFIYLIERHPEFSPKVVRLYRDHVAKGASVVTSTLTLGELIAQPLRRGREDMAQRYTELLTAGRTELVDFTRTAAEHYARIRAATSVRQPDAIQLACAVVAEAATFVTNDKRLWGLSVPGIESIRGL